MTVRLWPSAHRSRASRAQLAHGGQSRGIMLLVSSEARGRLLRAVAIATALGVVAWLLPVARHRILHALTWWDAAPSEPAALPPADSGPALPPATRVRVILIDGLAATTARRLPAWTATCARGTRLAVDAGFPTVTLPVEVALWTRLTH